MVILINNIYIIERINKYGIDSLLCKKLDIIPIKYELFKFNNKKLFDSVILYSNSTTNNNLIWIAQHFYWCISEYIIISYENVLRVKYFYYET